MRLILIMVCLVSCQYFQVLGQTNLVPNASFEDMKNNHTDKPTQAGQVEFMQNWKNFNTSDVYSNEPGKFAGTYGGTLLDLQAKTGNKYLGFGSCEGAQVKLTETVQKKKWVTVSFWFSPRGFDDTEINVYLLQNEAPSNALVDCQNPNIDFEVNFKAPVQANNSLGTAEHTPGEWYYFKSEPQLVVDEEYDWLAIKGENVTGAFSENRYIYIDDVTVETFDFCDHICSGQGDVQFLDTIPNYMVGNSPQNFFARVENATEVEMFVWNSFGELGYYWNSFDVEGLIDPGYNDFAIVWNGNSTLTGGDFIPTNVYNMRIIAKSCKKVINQQTAELELQQIQHDGSILIGNISDPPAVIYDETQNRDAPNCCPDQIYYQNIVFGGYNRTSMNDFIIAGSMVTAGVQGNVVVTNTGDVGFRAGNFIDLQNGFQVNPGGLFTASIEPCGASPGRFGAGQRDYYEQLRENQSIIEEESPERIEAYPNPNDGGFYLRGLRNEHSHIAIYDMLGQTVYEGSVKSNNQYVELDNVSSGLYTVKVYFKDGGYESLRMSIR